MYTNIETEKLMCDSVTKTCVYMWLLYKFQYCTVRNVWKEWNLSCKNENN